AVALSPAFGMLTVTADPPGVIENETAAALPPSAAATSAAKTTAQKIRVDVLRTTESHGRPPNVPVLPPNGGSAAWGTTRLPPLMSAEFPAKPLRMRTYVRVER